jgi:hemoglobin
MNTSTSLYDVLGGEPTIDKAVEEFYKKVLADDDLIEFFEGVNMDQLKKHQKNFFTFALGGPSIYAGKNMRKAHENMKLEDLHFDKIKEHLATSLSSLGANAEQVQTVMDVVETTRTDILQR